MKTEQDLKAIQDHLQVVDKRPWTWVFYGDSIPHGALHTYGWRSFPEIFAERVRWELRLTYDRVVNTAISGETTAKLIDPEGYEWRIRSLKPDCVLIMVGVNDITKLPTAEDFHTNLIKLVRMLREDKAIPVLQTYAPLLPDDSSVQQKRVEHFAEYMEIIRAVAAAEDVLLIDHTKNWAAIAADPKLHASYLGDGVLHPGAKGHLELAKGIFRAFGIDAADSRCENIIIP